MKYLAGFFMIMWLLACNSNNTDKQAETEDSTIVSTPDSIVTFTPVDTSAEFIQTYSSNLQPWLQKTTRQTLRLDNFKYADNLVQDFPRITTANLTPDFYKTYKSVLIYSPDSSKVLDLGSYGAMVTKNAEGKTTLVQGEPDSEIAVLDRVTRKRRQLLWFGPTTSVEHGFWLNDSTVLLAGKTEDSATHKPVPMIWTVLMEKNSNIFTMYKPREEQ